MMPDSEARRKRNLYAALAGMTAALMLIGAFLWGAAMAQRSEVSSANAVTLAEQVKQACANGQLVIDERNLCSKAEQVAEAPAELVPGPPGPKGEDGADGKDGEPGTQGPPGPAGANGEDGAPGPAGADGADGATGPAGADGLNGVDGAPGAMGPAGPAGADSTVPGPPGPAGEPGTDGAPGPTGPAGPQGPAGATGPAPSSFTFTDRTGATYTCTPNPPGSTTYTCQSDGKVGP